MPHGLSKSKFQAGLQCHKLLWWKVREPEAPELVPGLEQQRVFDRGTEVGDRARAEFPGGVLIERGAVPAMLEATRVAVERGATSIYEASFAADGVFVAVDVLQRDGAGWRLIEVKSSTRVKPQHITDAAAQLHVLERSGLDVVGVDVMVLNRECVFPDLGDLFVRRDVTSQVRALAVDVPDQVEAQRLMLEGELPEVESGAHCSTPYPCPFRGRCWPARPDHHVSSLYRGGALSGKLESGGFETIQEIPEDFALNATQSRQRKAVIESRLICEPGLGRLLAELPGPVGYLDFETVAPPIPRWDGCRPYDPVPVQFVYYERSPGGGSRMSEWLADDAADPRPQLAQELVDACRGAGTVLAWNAGFEMRVIEGLAAAVPALRSELEHLNSRLVDLLPLVRNHVYDPAFNGSFALKSVLPALVPDLSYQALEIRDGQQASGALERLVSAVGMSADERARLRAALQAYCRLDTYGMVRMHDRLLELAT